MKIKDQNLEDRPREKMKEFGIRALSHRELLALVLRSGTKGKSALELADDLLKQSNGIHGLVGIEYEELIKISGIKSAKASEICAITELDNIGSQNVLIKAGFLRQQDILDEGKMMGYFLLEKKEIG